MADFTYQFLNGGSVCRGLEISYPTSEGSSSIRMDFDHTLPLEKLDNIFKKYTALADMLGCESKVIHNEIEHAIELYPKERSPEGLALFIVDDLANSGYITQPQRNICIQAIKTYSEERTGQMQQDAPQSFSMQRALEQARNHPLTELAQYTPGDNHNPVRDKAALANAVSKGGRGGVDGIG